MTISNAAIFGPTFVPGRVGQNQPIVFWDDFVTAYTVVQVPELTESDPSAKFCTLADRGEWLVTTQGGVGSHPSIAEEAGGVVTMTTGSSNNERISCQLNGEMFKLDGGRELYFEARVHLSTSADLYMGVADEDTTLSVVENGVMFLIEGTSTVFTRVEKNEGGTDTATAATLEDDAYSTIAFKCRADKKVLFYLNGERIATVDTPDNFPDDVTLTPSFEIRSNGVAETLKIDYILCVGDRP